MEIKKVNVLNFSNEEEKALEVVYDIFEDACDARLEDKDCGGCPLGANCPLNSGNRLQAMKNFIKKIAD